MAEAIGWEALAWHPLLQVLYFSPSAFGLFVVVVFWSFLVGLLLLLFCFLRRLDEVVKSGYALLVKQHLLPTSTCWTIS